MNKTKKKIIRILLVFVLVVAVGIVSLELLATRFDYKQDASHSLLFRNIGKAIVIVPHQDDEIFTAGGLITQLNAKGIDTEVVFFTNGNANDNIGWIRQKEAIRSCEKLGCTEDKVTCLQFPNRQQSDTTDISGVSDVALRDSMKNSLANVIISKKPDIIVCTDFDFNRDHRTLSILFDETLGELLNKEMIGKPIVIKGFSYQTSYNAPKDYYAINIKSMKKPEDPQNRDYETDVPAYLWNNRLRVPLSPKSLTHSAFHNNIYKAIKENKTQSVINKAYSAINGDNVFWYKRTDNLLYNARISVTSGNPDYLRDFKLYDTRNVTITNKYNVKFEDFLWQPDSTDKTPQISFTFDEPVIASSICIYDDPSFKNQITDASVIINDSMMLNTGCLNNEGSGSILKFGNNFLIRNLKICDFKYKGEPVGISEVELLHDIDYQKDIYVFKIIEDRNKDFVYRYYIDNDAEELSLSIYANHQFNAKWEIIKKDGDVSIHNGKLSFGKNFEKCTVKVQDTLHTDLYDIVEIERLNGVDSFLYTLLSHYDKMKLGIVNAFYSNRLVHSICKHTIFKAIKRHIFGE